MWALRDLKLFSGDPFEENPHLTGGEGEGPTELGDRVIPSSQMKSSINAESSMPMTMTRRLTPLKAVPRLRHRHRPYRVAASNKPALSHDPQGLTRPPRQARLILYPSRFVTQPEGGSN